MYTYNLIAEAEDFGTFGIQGIGTNYKDAQKDAYRKAHKEFGSYEILLENFTNESIYDVYCVDVY